jgi:hypothetical protein
LLIIISTLFFLRSNIVRFGTPSSPAKDFILFSAYILTSSY